MKKHEQADRLAWCSSVQVLVTLLCDECHTVTFSFETNCIAVAVRAAVKAGWRACDAGYAYCPNCAPEELR